LNVLPWLLPPVIALVISFIYFWTSPRSQPLPARLLASLHGATICALYVLAIAVASTGKSKYEFGWPYALAMAIPVLLIVASFFVYRGRKATHWLQPLNLLCVFWTFIGGGMLITGETL